MVIWALWLLGYIEAKGDGDQQLSLESLTIAAMVRPTGVQHLGPWGITGYPAHHTVTWPLLH